MTDEEMRKNVFLFFGSAAYYAQCFEVELVTLLISLKQMVDPNVTAQELDTLDDLLSKKSLGKLLYRLKKQIKVAPDIVQLFDGYLTKRNYLIHHFFFQNADKLLNYQGCDLLVAELKELSILFHEADLITQDMSKKVRKHLGLSEDFVQQNVKQYLDNAQNKLN